MPYSGGSVLNSLLSANVIPPLNMWAIVRSDAQAEKLKALGVNTSQVSLADDDKIRRVVIENNSEYSVRSRSHTYINYVLISRYHHQHSELSRHHLGSSALEGTEREKGTDKTACALHPRMQHLQ